MSVRVLNLDAGELKALRKDPEYRGGPVILDAVGGGGLAVADLASVNAAVERLNGPVILAGAGTLDAGGVALCCACASVQLHTEARVGAIDPEVALRLGLAGRLTERLGAAGASRILLGPDQTEAVFDLGLARASADPLGDARALAERLDDPAGRLLTRSLAFAARSTTAQAAAYDAELLAVLDQRDDPQTDR
jgi:enoyl-CoA hydratase/carnithine racemase